MIAEIRQLLSALKLRGMTEKLDIILEEAEKKGLATLDVILSLLREEFYASKERSMKGRLCKAKLPWDWSLQTFPFEKQPGVNKLQIMNIANLSFIERKENIVLIGEPGTGKSGIAISLLRQSLVNGYRGLFYNAQKLLDDLYSTLADKSTANFIKLLSNIDVLLIDELGYLTLSNEQSNAFFKLMDMRYNKKPTIITTNMDYHQWYDLFAHKSLVDALLDRLQHHCITIHINGPSLRAPAQDTEANTKISKNDLLESVNVSDEK